MGRKARGELEEEGRKGDGEPKEERELALYELVHVDGGYISATQKLTFHSLSYSKASMRFTSEK